MGTIERSWGCPGRWGAVAGDSETAWVSGQGQRGVGGGFWFLRGNLGIRPDVKSISGNMKWPLGGGTWFGWREESIWIYGNDAVCTGSWKAAAKAPEFPLPGLSTTSWSHYTQAGPTPAHICLICPLFYQVPSGQWNFQTAAALGCQAPVKNYKSDYSVLCLNPNSTSFLFDFYRCWIYEAHSLLFWNFYVWLNCVIIGTRPS